MAERLENLTNQEIDDKITELSLEILYLREELRIVEQTQKIDV